MNKIELVQNIGGIFKVGQVVEVKGSFFKVSKITPKKLTLRLLSKAQWANGVESQENQMQELKNKFDDLEKFGPNMGGPEKI